MLKYFFITRLSPSMDEALNSGILLHRLDAGLDQEGEHGQLGAAGLLVLLVDLHAEGFQVGDVGVLVVGDGRDHDPVARQVGAGNLLDARQRLDFDGAELGEVDLRPGQQVEPRL
jgi:hypothetical protein